MKQYNSSALLDNLYQQTEQHIQKAIVEWQNTPDSVMNSSPQPGSWSAAQCLEHLNIYGRYYLPAIEKAISKSELSGKGSKDIFRSGWLGNYFTHLMMPNESGNVKSKMKTPAMARPMPALHSEAVVAEFIDQQEQLMSLLHRAAAIDLNSIRIPISIAKFIKLKLGDVFSFLIAHNYRHILQAERALRSSGKYQAKQLVTRFQLA